MGFVPQIMPPSDLLPDLLERGSIARSAGRSLLRAWLALLILAALFGPLGAGAATAQSAGTPRVLVTTIKAPITPVVAGHIGDGIARAERDGYDAYLIRLDTPGGLDTSMRDIVQHLFAAEVPVIVHIAPAGARGASAGAVITFAAHVAAMSPGTSIGAATPVAGGSGEDLDAKIINDAIAYVESIADARGRDREFIVDTVAEGRSASASEALELGAIDVIASSTSELLEAIDGLVVTLGPDERAVTLRTAGATVDEQEMGLFRSIQQLLADPNVAFLLLSIGTLGLIYELASPGLGVGAVLGLTFVTLGLFGLAVLSVNLVGIVFLLLAMALFVAEVFAPGLGIAAAGGAFALVLSGVFLFDDAPGLQISLAVILPVALVVSLFVIIAGRIAMRARRAPATSTGTGLFIGRRVTVRTPHGSPQVFVEGAWWSIRPTTEGATPTAPVELTEGTEMEVVAVDGLVLVVAPVADPTVTPPTVTPSSSTPSTSSTSPAPFPPPGGTS